MTPVTSLRSSRPSATPQIQQWSARVIVDTDEARAWMASWASTWEAETDVCWAVERQGVVVGRVAVRDIDLFAGIGEVTYWVLPSARGGGIASGAAAEVTRWAFELGLHRLELFHSVHNEGSCGVARRAGFILEGTLRDGALHLDRWHDMHLHARLAPDGVRD
jgi:ribosomal-protein-alanine N-acetyltransferase